VKHPGGTFTFLLLLTIIPAPARATPPAHTDFADTRLTITFGDDDLLTDGEDGSMLPGFGDRPLFRFPYDNLDTKDTGRESATHLVLYRKMPAFFQNVTVDAALVARLDLLNLSSATQVLIRDTGSYIRVHYHPWKDEQEGLSIIAFPFDADRVRLGYLYRLSLSGVNLVRDRKWLGAPGIKFQLTVNGGYYYAAFKAVPGQESIEYGKSPSGTENYVAVTETQYSGLAGAGWDLLGDRLRLELGGGFFEMGSNPLRDMQEEPYFTFGGAFRVVWHDDLPIERSIDMTLYTNDLNQPFMAFRPVRYVPGRLGYLLSLEAVILGQNLADPDQMGETTIQPAVAVALQWRMVISYLRLEVTALLKDLAFLVHANPGLVSATAMSDESQTEPQFLGAFTVDYHFPAAHLTLALSGGFLRPANYLTELYSNVPGGSTNRLGHYRIVVTDSGRFTLLPDGKTPELQVYSRIQARLDIAEMLYLLGWVQLVHDPNRYKFGQNSGGFQSMEAVESLLVGLGITAAVRF